MEVKRVFDILYHQAENYPQKVSLSTKVNGEWINYSTEEFIDIVETLALGLLAKGITKGDKIGIVSWNRPEWNFVDFATQMIGAISVPMYPNTTEEDYKFIVEHAEVKMAFIASTEIYDTFTAAMSKIAHPPELFLFDEQSGISSWKEVVERGKGRDIEALQSIKSQIREDELMSIIYTSGTTGDPKGVMLNHINLRTNVEALDLAFNIKGHNDRALSFLPLCHIFERTACNYYIYRGFSVYYAENMETIADNMKEVRPHIFTSVPRLLEKIYDAILAKGYGLSPVKKFLFFWAVRLGLKYDPNKKFSKLYVRQLKLANKIIFSKWREALGGRVRFIVTGAAALQPRLARIFWAARIKVLEGYGLTETSPGVSFSKTDDIRIGCCGTPIKDVEIKIAEDGEILIKGPNIMMGYYKRPDLTEEVIKDGWFHTGDIGKMVEENYLKITDRKKEIFKTSGGKYIAPQSMENVYKESIVIEQVMVVGANEKFPSALIVPNFDRLRDWCEIHKMKYTSDASMIKNEQVLEKFQKEIDGLNERFAQYEKIKKFVLLHKPWSVKGTELTPTMKIKRNNIMVKYKKEVASIYK